ncbi:hypothetical protein [Dactylosporangium sp. NPDC051541]|uniref:hypothetical protein n=1 Tax=Dactylosporangium sp. NPDC051541 TaxID=3363977 RepID=UPI00379F7836
MADTVPGGSVWEGLPHWEHVKQWDRAVPGAAETILRELEADARWIRRDAERRLNFALLLMVLTIVATVVLALLDKTLPAIFSSSGGAIGVAGTLIGGRSPALRRRKRGGAR